MEKYHLVSKEGKPYSVEIPPPCQKLLSSAYLFAFQKSGSTLMNNMVTQYCRRIHQPVFSLFDRAFAQGVGTHDIQADAAQCFKNRGYIYTGFRHFPDFDINLEGATIILLTRDPRDMLVSGYYSTRTSHVIPKGLDKMQEIRAEATMMNIDEFVLKRRNLYKRLLRRYRQALGELEVTTYRYEDVIYRKDAWLSELIDILGLDNVPRIVSAVAKESNVFPASEDENRHIRQVHPGNYKEKLSAETIDALNESLREFLTFFNYEI